MTSTADLIAAYKREGGKVTTCAPGRALNTKPHQKLKAAQVSLAPQDASKALVERLRADFRALLALHPDAPRRGERWWAAYLIQPCDP